MFGRYEAKQEQMLVNLLQQSQVFWDVGAHVGWYSMLAVKTMNEGKIYTFEPNPGNLKYIQHHMHVNNAQNMYIQAIALHSSSGQQHFTANNQQGSISQDGDLLINTMTADDFYKKCGIAPDLIKVDIEGAESEFLEGAIDMLSKYKPTIVLSTHGYKKRDFCIDFLTNLNYKITQLVNNKEHGDYVFLAQIES